MNTIPAAGGAVPVINILDYLSPGINRPDLYQQRAYPIQPSGGGSARSIQRMTASGEERTPTVTLYYTVGLIILSAAIFLTLAAWSNVLLSWYDSIYVSPLVASVTKSRLYFAITLTIISIVVVALLILIWYYFTVYKNT